MQRLALPLVAVAVALSHASNAAALCYQHPFSGYVISNPYGTWSASYTSGYHRGVDYAGLPSGTPVRAVADGEVVRSLYQNCQGNVVVVAHPDGMFSSYSHLLNGSRAAVGTKVAKGAQVGLLGKTGTCQTGVHLHLVIANHVNGYHSPPEVEPTGFIDSHSSCGPVCTNTCDGKTLRRADCSSVDCGAQDATCRNDAQGLRCVPNCYDRCLGNVLERADCGREDCGGAAVCKAGGSGLRCDQRPRGNFEAASAERLVGWAHDPSVAEESIDAHFWLGGPAGTPGVRSIAARADLSRSDLCGALGSCGHAFSRRTPRSLMDGVSRHVHAYGLDASGGENAELAGSPRTLQLFPPGVAPGTLLRKIASPASFAAWRFSDFEDVAPLKEEPGRFDGTLPATPDFAFPTTPELVEPDDGTGSRWIVDQGVRRRVADPAAWRFGAAKPMNVHQLLLLPRGRDWPALPTLVRTLGPTDFVVDEPFRAEDGYVAEPEDDPVAGAAGVGGGRGSAGPGGGTAAEPTAAEEAGSEASGSCVLSSDRRAPGLLGLLGALPLAALLRLRRRAARLGRA